MPVVCELWNLLFVVVSEVYCVTTWMSMGDEDSTWLSRWSENTFSSGSIGAGRSLDLDTGLSVRPFYTDNYYDYCYLGLILRKRI